MPKTKLKLITCILLITGILTSCNRHCLDENDLLEEDASFYAKVICSNGNPMPDVEIGLQINGAEDTLFLVSDQQGLLSSDLIDSTDCISYVYGKYDDPGVVVLDSTALLDELRDIILQIKPADLIDHIIFDYDQNQVLTTLDEVFFNSHFTSPSQNNLPWRWQFYPNSWLEEADSIYQANGIIQQNPFMYEHCGHEDTLVIMGLHFGDFLNQQCPQ